MQCLRVLHHSIIQSQLNEWSPIPTNNLQACAHLKSHEEKTEHIQIEILFPKSKQCCERTFPQNKHIKYIGSRKEKVTDWHTLVASKSRHEDRIHPQHWESHTEVARNERRQGNEKTMNTKEILLFNWNFYFRLRNF